VPQLGIIREIEEDEIKIDFNHPLSGQVVLFDFEILGVK
jgi:FKBP-type peptidyl-prolyl cis-trans isomerases 2